MTLLQDHWYLALGFAWVCLCTVQCVVYQLVSVYRAIYLEFLQLGVNVPRKSLCTHNFFLAHCFCPYHFKLI